MLAIIKRVSVGGVAKESAGESGTRSRRNLHKRLTAGRQRQKQGFRFVLVPVTVPLICCLVLFLFGQLFRWQKSREQQGKAGKSEEKRGKSWEERRTAAAWLMKMLLNCDSLRLLTDLRHRCQAGPPPIFRHHIGKWEVGIGNWEVGIGERKMGGFPLKQVQTRHKKWWVCAAEEDRLFSIEPGIPL